MIYILESRTRTTVENPWGNWKQANAIPFNTKSEADEYMKLIGFGNKWVEFRIAPYIRVEDDPASASPTPLDKEDQRTISS